MNNWKSLRIAFCLGTVLVALSPRAKADEWNKKTIITIDQPLDVSGTVLQPGKYVLRLVDSAADRNIVRVLNADETKVEATIRAIPGVRAAPANKTEFAYWEMPAGQPAALRAWFYPGDVSGQEFLRPAEVATTTTAAQAMPAEQPPIVAEAAPPQEPAPAPAPAEAPQAQPEQQPAPAPAPAEAPQAQPEQQPAPAPAPAETAQAQPEQQPAPAPTQEESSAMPEPQPVPSASLPKTASPYPLVGLGGLLSLGAAMGTRLLKRMA